ncbi:MAG: hypothetical protein K2X64_00030 [Rhodocyclaceae bacterium]|nr:hypothetical protein [Rhodocyclaceae bacterium]
MQTLVAHDGYSDKDYGVSIDANIVTASLKALVSSANRVAVQAASRKAA